MAIRIRYDTHSWSDDNEHGIASGWNHSFLSPRGRALAGDLGARHRQDPPMAVFVSDLRRAAETAEVAFGADPDIPLMHDWRLRECDYGALNGAPARDLEQTRRDYLETPYPGGESWSQAIERFGRFLDDLWLRWDDQDVVIIGHLSTYWALRHFVDGVAIDDLVGSPFDWKSEGWEFTVERNH